MKSKSGMCMVKFGSCRIGAEASVREKVYLVSNEVQTDLFARFLMEL